MKYWDNRAKLKKLVIVLSSIVVVLSIYVVRHIFIPSSPVLGFLFVSGILLAFSWFFSAVVKTFESGQLTESFRVAMSGGLEILYLISNKQKVVVFLLAFFATGGFLMISESEKTGFVLGTLGILFVLFLLIAGTVAILFQVIGLLLRSIVIVFDNDKRYRSSRIVAYVCKLCFFVVIWVIFTVFLAGIITVGLGSLDNNLQFTNLRFPLGFSGGIVVDDEGCIYHIGNFYNRLQVFDSEGKFLRGRFIPIIGNLSRSSNMFFDENDNLHIEYDFYETEYPIKDINKNIYRVYSKQGELLKERSDKFTLAERNSSFKFKSGGGEIYEVKDCLFFPKITKITSTGERVIVRDTFLLKVFSPQLLFHTMLPIMFLGSVLYFIFIKLKWKIPVELNRVYGFIKED